MKKSIPIYVMLVLISSIILCDEIRPVNLLKNQQQNYSGTYTMSSGDVTITVTLNQDQNLNLSGSLRSSNGSNFTIEGMVSEGMAIGACSGNEGALYFEAYLDGNDLTFSLISPDQNNMPDYNTAQYIVLSRSAQQPSTGQPALSPIEQLTKTAPAASQNMTQAPPSPSSNLSTNQTTQISNEEAGDEIYGYKFRKPAGWNHQKGEGYIMLGSNTIPGLILVLPHQSNDMVAMTAEMQQGLQDEGISLNLSSQVEQKAANMASAFCQGIVQGEQAKGYCLGVLSPQGGGIYILAISTPDKFGNDIIAAANTIGQNAVFSKPSAGDQSLVKHFAGEWMWTNGYRTEWMMFFPDGTYSDQYEASYSGNFTDGGGNVTGNWGAMNQDSNRGRWTIQGTKDAGVITVVNTDGSQTRYDYKVFVEKGEKFYWEYMLNGYHYRKNKAY